MAITPAEAALIRMLLDVAIIEITKKVQQMTPEELATAQKDAEAKTEELMNEIESH